VLADVDLELEPGELLAIAGPNGAGKSTLLRLLAGDRAPATGTVELGGSSLAGMPRRELARRRAVMPQHTSIGFGFTVRQVVEMGCHPLRASYDGLEDVVGEALARTGIPHLADRSFRTLSGGEQALATFARVLAQCTPVLLLDEPTASLDPERRGALAQTLRALAGEGRAMLLTTHDTEFATACAHRVVRLGVVPHGSAGAVAPG
jgi:iron complex transport system ATP-binding protein